VSGAPRLEFWSGKAVAVTGGAGFLGKPTVRMLAELGAEPRVIRSAEHDLRDRRSCQAALEGAAVVIHLAANVGGIGYNRRNPAPLTHDNLAIGINVFESCRELDVAKLVVASSVCAYPLSAAVPIAEDNIWEGYPEPSNAPYGLAKRMLVVLSDTYRHQYGLDSCVPVIANLYGPDDNFDLEDSHVIAAMIRKYVEAVERKEERVTLWGTGQPTREFLYVGDAARALLLAAERCETSQPINIGTGTETRIRDLAETIRRLTGFEGETAWDDSHPDGQPRRYLDVTRAREMLGFEAEVQLTEGLRRTIDSFRSARAAGAAA
jgi:GDP-L-fucose synthase